MSASEHSCKAGTYLMDKQWLGVVRQQAGVEKLLSDCSNLIICLALLKREKAATAASQAVHVPSFQVASVSVCHLVFLRSEVTWRKGRPVVACIETSKNS